MTVDHMVERDQFVTDLRDAIRDGASGLAYVPRLLERVLDTGAWRERYDQTSRQRVPFASFAEFVAAQPTEGLGADIALIKRIVADKPAVRDKLDQALQNPVGTTKAVDNINGLAPRGTSKDYALRKLRKDAPELHARVIAGELSPHAAMVQAGFRPPTFTVRAESAESVVAALRRRLPPEMLAQVAHRLGSVIDDGRSS